MTRERYDVAIVGSGFAGSLMARVLAVLGYQVVLFERGTHPRFAIGESTTPLANLSLERLGARYGLADCYRMAAHGRWLEHHSAIRCGLKRGFTFYRHHPGKTLSDRGSDAERLLVAASPNDLVSDTHWLRGRSSLRQAGSRRWSGLSGPHRAHRGAVRARSRASVRDTKR